MNIKDLPNKKEYVETWKKVNSNPNGQFKHFDWVKGIVSGAQLSKEFTKALMKRINSRVASETVNQPFRKLDSDYQRSLFQSQAF